jgi:hypothetical protein
MKSLAVNRLQAACRAFLRRLEQCPGRGTMLIEIDRLRRQLDAHRRSSAPPPVPIPTSPASEQRTPQTPVPTQTPSTGAGSGGGAIRRLEEAGSLERQLQLGLRHALSAVTVFEVADFLSDDSLVVESHVFADQHGFAWRMWVKPHDKGDCIGLYLVPAEDLPEVYTADFELAIIGRHGKVWRRELYGGRATLQKRCAGHGWPMFVTREEMLKAEDEEANPDGMLHDGKLVVTARKIENVRPKVADEQRALAHSL